jgi:hypothetical protein
MQSIRFVWGMSSGGGNDSSHPEIRLEIPFRSF